MSQVKDDIKQMLDGMPDDCTLEDVQRQLCILAKIDQGLAAIRAGDVVSHAEMGRRLNQWQKSRGLPLHKPTSTVSSKAIPKRRKPTRQR